MQVLDRDLKKTLRAQTKQVVGPEWQKALNEHALTRTEVVVLANTARVAVSDQNVTLKSATVGRRLSGGLEPKRHWSAIEFGAQNQDQRVGYERRSKNGGTYQVKRRTARQLRPRNPQGYVVYASFADVVPRIAALWTQTIARGLFEALEAGD
jgi:hypothetical protein